MKVLFDHQIFENQTYGGISRYHYELLRHLPEVGVDVELSVKLSNNYYIKNKDCSSHSLFFPRFNLKIRNKYIKNENLYFSKKKIIQSGFDLFHPTYYDNYFLKMDRSFDKPMVVTIHDMTLEKFIQSDKYISMKHQIMKRADKIIAISENTKTDILNYLDIPSDKVVVIYHGNNIKNQINVKPLNLNVSNPYILYVGARDGYKNFKNLIYAFSNLSNKYKDLYLICTGANFSREELSLFVDLKINQRVRNYRVTDDELAFLYKNAELFVYPSIYEGFGMPILEAFACECPVAISNTSCFPEIAKDAAIYFDPQNRESIFNSISSILESSELKKHFKQLGSNRLKDFSWEKAASETAMVYRNVL